MNIVPLVPEPEVTVSFETFYVLYARHEARKDALKAWGQLPPADQLAAIVGAAKWRRIYLARGLEHVPYPATFLRGERWLDELPDDQQPQHASHVPATSTPLPDRGVIPDAVLKLFKTLRERK